MKWIKAPHVITALVCLFTLGTIANAAFPPSTTGQGGTGTTSPSGILYGSNSNITPLQTVVVGTGLSFSGGTLSATGGSGTVTQVNTTYPILGGPITTTGTLSIAFGTTTSNTWAGTQTFTNAPVLGSLSGLIAGNSGILYQVSTSTPSIGSVLTYSGTLGSFAGGTSGTFGIANAAITDAMLASTFLKTIGSGTNGQLSYWSGTNTLSGVSTSTLTVSGPFTYPAISIIGASGAITYTGLATTSQPSSSNLLVSNGSSGVYGVATSSASCGTGLSCSAFTVVGGVSPTITLSTPVSIANGGTATTTGGVTNGVEFYNGSTLTNDSSLVHLPGSNTGAGTSTPTSQLAVSTTTASAPTTSLFAVASSTNGNLLAVNGAGQVALTAVDLATSTANVLDWLRTPEQVGYRIGTSAATITLINATTSYQSGSRKLVWICNPGTAAGALTWVGVEWIGTAPTQTTTANQCDVYSFDVTNATSTTAYKVAGTAGTGFQ